MTVDSRCHIELVLKANQVQVTNEQRSNSLLTKDMVRESVETSLVPSLVFPSSVIIYCIISITENCQLSCIVSNDMS